MDFMDVLAILSCVLVTIDLPSRRRTSKLLTYVLMSVVAVTLVVVPLLFLCGGFTMSRLILWLFVVGYLCLRLVNATYVFAHTQDELSTEPTRIFTRLGIFYNAACMIAVAVMVILAVALPRSVLFLPKLASYALVAAAMLLCGPFGLFIAIGLAIVAVMTLQSFWAIVLLCIVLLIAAGLLFAAVPVYFGLRAARSAIKPLGMSKRAAVLFTVFMCFPFANLITMLVLRSRVRKGGRV